MDAWTFDVAILGGGLAGNLLARQLVRRFPGLAVGLFEKEIRPGYKVGESTVEIASNYLTRRLGLTTYLYDEHLPKNGLRFFFDRPEKDAALADMTEIGTKAFPFHASFQVNRARLEADLRTQNAAAGVRCSTGVRVTDLELGARGAGHAFTITGPEGTQRCRSRWVVDAAGRASPIARALDLRVPDDHAIAAVWGRFEHVTDIDALGPPSFRSRVRHTCRALSTIHFSHPGYWIWFIPLRHGVTSVGVVAERESLDAACRTRAGFLEFLGRHRAVSSLLTNATMVDLGSYGQLAYGTRRFFSADRWGLTGEAGAFADPFYSPGSDYIALQNDFITDLVARDLAGEDITARADLYDAFMLFRHEAAMRLYRGLYPLLGSYELYRHKWRLDITCYYNLWVAPYMQDLHLDEAFLQRQLRERAPTLQLLANFADLFQKAERTLRARGQLHRQNLGRFQEPLEGVDAVAEIGLPCEREDLLGRVGTACNAVRDGVLDALEDVTMPRERKSAPLAAFMLNRPIG